MALIRAAILRHVRTPLQAATKFQPWNASIRSLSSDKDRITKEEVVDRVAKDSHKVDPSKVTPHVHFGKDLGMNSLDTVRVLIALQEEFKPMF